MVVILAQVPGGAGEPVVLVVDFIQHRNHVRPRAVDLAALVIAHALQERADVVDQFFRHVVGIRPAADGGHDLRGVELQRFLADIEQLQPHRALAATEGQGQPRGVFIDRHRRQRLGGVGGAADQQRIHVAAGSDGQQMQDDLVFVVTEFDLAGQRLRRRIGHIGPAVSRGPLDRVRRRLVGHAEAFGPGDLVVAADAETAVHLHAFGDRHRVRRPAPFQQDALLADLLGRLPQKLRRHLRGIRPQRPVGQLARAVLHRKARDPVRARPGARADGGPVHGRVGR